MKNSSALKIKITLPLIVLSGGLTANAWAGPDLVVHPSRIVFEKNTRTAEVDLTNTGDQPGTYRIVVENKRMDENGKFSIVEKDSKKPEAKPLPDEHFASDFIQYSPRQVELAPGAGQVVRVTVRKPADLAAGEYRSHLTFQRIPDANTNSVENINKPGKNEIGIVLTALVGVSIPVIVRNGDTQASASLSDFAFLTPKQGEPPTAKIKINRTGSQSLYGDLLVELLDDHGEAKEQLAAATGFAVYTPNSFRIASLNLRSKTTDSFSKKKLRWTFKEQPSSGGKTIAEGTYQVP